MSGSSPSFQLRPRGRSNATLTRLDRELKLPAHDLLLVGDGSGESNWTGRIGLGWACVAVERCTGMRTLTQGAWSAGSIEFGELMAYFQALVTYEQTRGETARRQWGHAISTLILTDNEVVCLQAAAGLRGQLQNQATAPLWAALSQLSRKGYQLRFQHIPRLSIRLNAFCDRLAEPVRKAVEGCNPIHLDPVPDLMSMNPST